MEGYARHVLVIEDDGELAEAIAAGLRLEGMAVDTALDGDSGLERAMVNDYDVIALDEVGYVPLAEIGAEFLFQVIAERAERATLIVTTNLPFSEWTQVFPNPRLCKALLDRITDRAHIIETGTESYRFRRTVEGRQKKKAS